VSPNCHGVMRVVACELPDEVATMYTSQILMGCLPARTHRQTSSVADLHLTPVILNRRTAISKDYFIPCMALLGIMTLYSYTGIFMSGYVRSC
jgi:hypothetical protein